MTGRLVIDDIRPRTPDGGYPAKAVVGEAVVVTAVVFKEGHDLLAGRVALFAEGSRQPDQVAPLVALGNDRWQARIVPERLGRQSFVVQAWTDQHATWAHKVRVKLEAGQDVEVERAEGMLLLEAALDRDVDGVLVAALEALADDDRGTRDRLGPALRPEVAALLVGPEGACDLTVAPPKPLWVDRDRALFGSWYELFPRSYGGFRGTEARLPAVAAMGFDVVYLPPIHPIGSSHRKGPNNTLVASPNDPGSPWAIGSADGGHTAIHPDLGTFEDFAHLVATARSHGLEIALDYALNCSPDHPWVHEHPEWFHHRPDGSIAYSENPPKKYQDIFPLNFWPAKEDDRIALWRACREILDFWIERGVAIFRVDNPHTKPVAFWEWVIPAIQARSPEVIFLAEAFTRPAVMAKLAEVGFSQSYTYFTWRTQRDGADGIWAYFEEVSQGPSADYMRPNFWPSTPDILAHPLRRGAPAAFALRLILAATASPSFGVYSGYELYENEPASEDNEEYLFSEKYQLRERDFDQTGSLAPLIGQLNAIRRRHPALQRLRNLRMLVTSNPQLVAFGKVSDDGADAVVVVVTLDPEQPQEGVVHLDLVGFGLPAAASYEVRDELSGERYRWSGADQYVRLEPWSRVAHVIDLHPDDFV